MISQARAQVGVSSIPSYITAGRPAQSGPNTPWAIPLMNDSSMAAHRTSPSVWLKTRRWSSAAQTRSPAVGRTTPSG